MEVELARQVNQLKREMDEQLVLQMQVNGREMNRK